MAAAIGAWPGALPSPSGLQTTFPAVSSSFPLLLRYRWSCRNQGLSIHNAGKVLRDGLKCEASTGNLSTSGTEWVQRTVELPQLKRGCHIITQHIYRAVPEISQFKVGLAHIFVMHTSASLTINENASPEVPLDMEDTLNRIVPQGQFYRHLDEGLDDMPAHIKASMMGSSLTIPITGGRLNLGIWQGIWLNEHRDNGGFRSLCITLQGEKRPDGRLFR